MEILFYIITALLPALLLGLTWKFFKSLKKKKVTKFNIILGNILILCFLLSLAFLVLESYYRFKYDETDSFSLSKVSQRWFKRHYHLNKNAFRDNVDYNLKQTPGKPRITFVGDSFTVGHGIKNVEARFVNRIKKAKPEWEVHCVAKNGFDSKSHLLILEKGLSLGYTLNKVVLVYCLNDITDKVPYWETTINRIYSQMAYDNNFFIKNSYFLNLMYFRFMGAWNSDIANYYQFINKYYSGSTWKLQKANLLKIRNLVKENKGDFLVVTFPFLHNIGKHYPYTHIHKKLNAFWKVLDVPHLDLLPVYSKYRPEELILHKYDAHPNVSAHQLAAETIINFLEKKIENN